MALNGKVALAPVAEQNGSVAAILKEPSIEIEGAWSLPGFGAGACGATAFGFVLVELLRRYDPVKTQDGCFLIVEYVDSIQLDRRYLLTHPDAQPIEIRKNGLAPAIPDPAHQQMDHRQAQPDHHRPL